MANSRHLAELNNGVTSWNQWRRENPHIIPDLRKADLSSFNLNFADFRGAKLSEAKFISTHLISANLSKANLSGANLSKADLRFANFSNSNLGKANLSGVNLSEANLKKAFLSEANLSRSLLKAANSSFTNLSRANLSKADLGLAVMRAANLQYADLDAVQALGTNFIEADLTGACLQDWNINSKTNLDDVQCDYVYLKKGRSFEFSSRYPVDRKFQLREFTKQFQKASENTEISFTNGMPELFRSFQELQQHYSDKVLVIQAIEPKSESAFIARIEVLSEADKGVAQMFYEEQRHLSKLTYRLLQEKSQIIDLYKQQNSEIIQMAKLLAVRDVNVNVEANSVSNSDGFTNNLQGANIANFANQVRDNARQQANQHNYSLETKSFAEAAEEIQALLDQLSQSYPTNTTAAKYAGVGVHPSYAISINT